VRTDLNQIKILTRREIEACIAGPLIRAYAEEIGEERAMAIAKEVITKLAREHGAQLAQMVGGNSLEHLSKVDKIFSSDNCQDIEILEATKTKSVYNITRCAYVDMYRALGMADLGYVLSCGRDFELIKGFNPKMKLRRTKTIMEGYDYCDFCITIDVKDTNDEG
jgi:hypothetical protein